MIKAVKGWLHRLLLVVAVVLGMGSSGTALAAASADILWVVDTSGSMGDDIAQVKTRIQDFHNAMLSAGIDAHYGLVRFGGSETLIQNITDFDNFNRVNGPFRSLTDNGGGTERGSTGVLVGLRQATFRAGSVINVILVTDEDDDSSAADHAAVATELRNRSALFNFVGVPGTDNTDARYGVLASSFGGRAFRILDFRNNPQPFFANFIDTKVREIIRALQCDVDRDSDIDRDDIALIMAARNVAASDRADPRDADGNGVINVLDARQCTLRCTRAACASGTPNAAPVAHAGAALQSEVGVTTVLDGRASSDANGDPLGYTWVQISAPAGSLSNLAQANTVRPSFVPDVPGVYNFNLVVSDGRANSPPASVAVTVAPRQVSTPNVVGRTRAVAEDLLRQAGLNPGGISAVTSSTVAAGTVVSQTAQPGTRLAAGSLVGLGVSIGNQVVIPALLNLSPAEAQAALVAAGFVPGTQVSGNSTSIPAGRVMGSQPPLGSGAAPGSRVNIIVSAGPDTLPPTAAITSPAAGSAVNGRVTITGTASDANLSRWTLEVAPAGETTWQRLGGGTTPVVGAALGTWDTGSLAPDFYRLRLTVEDGSFSRSVTADVRIDAALQIGRFELVYTDLDIPNPGVPLRLIRSYDSSVPASGAFGRSWRLAFTDANIREDANANVFITLPNGRRSAFAFTPTRVSPFFPGSTPAYTPAAGVHDKLEAVSCGLVVQSGGRWFCFPGDLYDPDTYLLTTREGVKYTISQSQGIQRVEDPAGNFVAISASGVRASSGRNIEFDRDAAGRITAITDPRGGRLTYQYDSAGRLVAARDALGQTTSYQYTGTSALIASIVTPEGCQPLRNSYASDGRIASATDANGHRTTFIYGADGRSKRITNALGQSTLIEYDERGNVVAETDAENRVTRFTHDASNNLTSVTLPSGRRTDYSFDARGNWTLARAQRSDGLVVDHRREFNSTGRITRYLTPTGASLNFSYDSNLNPRQLEVRGDDGALLNTVGFQYDAQGNLLNTTVGAGTWTYTYDTRGNLLTQREPGGGLTSFAYDGNGNTTRITRPDGTVLSFQYDLQNRVVEVTRNGALLRRMGYDSEGRLLTQTEAEGRTTRHAYSCSGQLTSVTDAAGAITQYRYDAADRLSDVALPNGLSRSYGYNARSLLNARRDTDGGRHALHHDADGLLSQVFTPNHPAGRATLSYNNLHQLVGVAQPDFEVRSTVDILGRVTSATEGPAGAQRTLAVAYGNQGLPVTVNENGRAIQSVYDGLGQRTRLTSPDGRITHYTYDAARRLTSVRTEGAGTVAFQYDSDNRRIRTDYSNGAFSTYAYADGKLASTALHDGSGALIQRFDHVTTANGYRTAVLRLDGRSDYSYDALWRLTGEARQSNTVGHATTSFAYDATGSRLEPGVVISGQRIVQAGADLYTYDASGNVVSRGAEQLRYDSSNRLISHARAGTTATYAYDGRGRRIRKSVGAVVREYLYDGQQILAEYNATGTIQARYTHGLGDDEVLMLHRGTDTFFYHADPQGNIIAITNAAGQVVQRYDYDAWGNILRATGSFAWSGNGLVNTRTFIGREWDAESGLYHLRARAYDPRIGRFLQKDPQQGHLRDPQSQHPYAYALNSPTHYSDPSGEVAAIQYVGLLNSGRWNSAGALIGFMHGFITPSFAFLGEFFGELNRAGPGGDVGLAISAAMANAEDLVQNTIQPAIERVGRKDAYTFASSYANGLHWEVGFKIKIDSKPLAAAVKLAGGPTSVQCTVTLVKAEGGFKSGAREGFAYLRQILHLPSQDEAPGAGPVGCR